MKKMIDKNLVNFCQIRGIKDVKISCNEIFMKRKNKETQCIKRGFNQNFNEGNINTKINQNGLIGL